jgi:uncharacterized alpha-E superfamily protein
VPDPKAWSLEALSARDCDERYAGLHEVLRQCAAAAYQLSDDLGARYFTHSSDARESVGV